MERGGGPWRDHDDFFRFPELCEGLDLTAGPYEEHHKRRAAPVGPGRSA